MNHDIKIMQEAQKQLWEVIMSYPEEDKLKVASVSLKVTIQLFQTMLDTEALEHVFEYALDHLPTAPSVLREERTIH